ncbi:MAG: YjiH family protein [Cellvibrionales bacterium]|nr:YjiH family protein [Cellvibrionales bacterium]
MNKNQTHANAKNTIKFIVFSLIGLIIFLTPLPINGQSTIVIAYLAEQLQLSLSQIIPTTLLITFWLSTLMATYFKFSKQPHPTWAERFFLPSIPWLIIRAAGTVFFTLCHLKIQIPLITSENTGQIIYSSLVPTLFSVFILAGFLLPFLVDFGLLELISNASARIMRPLFKLPGFSAINCMTSWVGDGTVGIMLAAKLLERGLYSIREAALIAANFSAVSITFTLVVLHQVNLEVHFFAYYCIICIAGISCAIILARIPPLSQKPNTYPFGKQSIQKVGEASEQTHSSLRLATTKAGNTTFKEAVLINGGFNSLELVLGVLPIIICIGVLGLVAVEYTPIFSWLSKPLVPLLSLLQIAEAKEAAICILAGFADMFIPAILASQTITSDETRFIIAALSVSQLIYLSETGAVILSSKIPLHIVDLILIFIIRTIVCLFIITALSKIYFYFFL